MDEMEGECGNMLWFFFNLASPSPWLSGVSFVIAKAAQDKK